MYHMHFYKVIVSGQNCGIPFFSCLFSIMFIAFDLRISIFQTNTQNHNEYYPLAHGIKNLFVSITTIEFCSHEFELCSIQTGGRV